MQVGQPRFQNGYLSVTNKYGPFKLVLDGDRNVTTHASAQNVCFLAQKNECWRRFSILPPSLGMEYKLFKSHCTLSNRNCKLWNLQPQQMRIKMLPNSASSFITNETLIYNTETNQEVLDSSSTCRTTKNSLKTKKFQLVSQVVC